MLRKHGFTGRIEEQLPERLGRPVDQELADLGHELFFDKILALSHDNTCASCHAPAAGFGDTQSIAIGVRSNDIVGPSREGPRNQRRSPMVMNTAFYPKLMWNGRFSAPSGDPFDSSLGFKFPAPEDDAHTFPANDPRIKHLLVAQGHIPPTELPEMAGFKKIGDAEIKQSRFVGLNQPAAFPRTVDIAPAIVKNRGTIQFLHELTDTPRARAEDGDVLPNPVGGFLNEPIRSLVLNKINNVPAYVDRFAKKFPGVKRDPSATPPVTDPHGIQFWMIGTALAEFQISLTRANAPIDRFARGERGSGAGLMDTDQKKGALLFFGKARCVECHSVARRSNEMFSDFEMYNIGVPPIAPILGEDTGNVQFFGPGQDEDLGLEDITSNPDDRYKFRTSPLRNVARQPTFFHNGSFTNLRAAIVHHLNVHESVLTYDPKKAGLDEDLTHRMGPTAPILATLNPLMQNPINLTIDEIRQLTSFVEISLTDPRSAKDQLPPNPASVPSGMPLPKFQ